MEIQLFLDKERKNEIKENIEFEQIIAGEITTKKIYIHNTIDYKINIKLSLEGENISLIKNVENIEPHKTKEIIFELNPKITLMKPITAKLKININYIIK